MRNNAAGKKRLTKEQIFVIVNENQAQLKKFGVKKIGVFGSFVRNEQNAESDLDLLVEFEQGKKSFRNFIGLAYYLEELFNMKVELVTTEGLSPYIGQYILKEVEYAAL